MKKEEFEFIGKKIFENRRTLAKILSQNITKYTTENFERFKMKESEYLQYREEIIGYFGEALYKDIEIIHQKVCNWAEKLANLTIKYGVSLTQSLRIVSLIRLVIWEIFNEELNQNRISCMTMVEVTERFDHLLDAIFRITGEVYENDSKNKLESAYNDLEEVSVPVVPIAKGIAVLPVIGSIDNDRAKLIMQVSLNESIRLSLQYFIIDLSGVSFIDSAVANALFQTINTLKLIGVEIIITGIRPAIAQTITRIGLNFNVTRVSSTLQIALWELGFKRVEGL